MSVVQLSQDDGSYAFYLNVGTEKGHAANAVADIGNAAASTCFLSLSCTVCAASVAPAVLLQPSQHVIVHALHYLTFLQTATSTNEGVSCRRSHLERP
jgi:hypothetical protein